MNAIPLHEDEIRETVSVWRSIWTQEWEQRNSKGGFVAQSLVNRVLGTCRFLFEPDSLSLFISQIIRKEIHKEMDHITDACFLEPGCGSGQDALLLTEEGATLTLLDVSPEAIRIAQDRFERAGKYGHFLCASLFHMPFESESFDMVWNIGVMEHFRRPVQIAGLKEMHRVCKIGGLVITAVPCTRGKVYIAAKTFAEHRGFWEVGYEEPVPSMRDRFSEVQGCLVLREYSAGFLWQFWTCRHFFKMIPYTRLRRVSQLAYSLIFLVLNRLLFPLNYLPGSWLVTVCRKVDNSHVEALIPN